MFTSEFIGSDFGSDQSLARYKSAPGSFLAALLDSDNNNNNNNNSSGDVDESEAFFSDLITGGPTSHTIKKEVSSPGLETAVSGGGGFIVGSYSVNTNGGAAGSTSPAFPNGFGGGMGEVGNYGVNNNIGPSSSSSSADDANGIMSSHLSFSSAPPSTTRFGPSHGPESGHLRNDSVREFESVYAHDSWNESSFGRGGGGLKRNRDGEMRMFSEFRGSDNQNTGENRKGSSAGLVHHLSLPKTSTEMADVEKYLQFQTETVPCQVRAKRGCATHPRSIAERVRRTRISEKMKKLQDLFPNMDKQTSTADMLDLAVEYIKDLQRQVEMLADMKTRCICSGKTQKHGSVI